VLTESRRLIQLVDEIRGHKRVGIGLPEFRSAHELVGEFQSARRQLVAAYQLTASSAELGIGRSPAVSTLVEPIDCVARLLKFLLDEERRTDRYSPLSDTGGIPTTLGDLLRPVIKSPAVWGPVEEIQILLRHKELRILQRIPSGGIL